VWEKGKNCNFELWVLFFGFWLLGELKQQMLASYNCFALFDYSDSVGKHFES